MILPGLGLVVVTHYCHVIVTGIHYDLEPKNDHGHY